MLVGRSSECARIDGLLNEVRGGAGGALVVLGEPGIGKTALLQYAARQAAGMKRLSILGVAAEAALPYAGLNELIRPVLWGLESLPVRQSRAIRLALGAGGDGATDALAVYAGTLALLAEAASRDPLMIIVDDAHWLDMETVNALGFAARRIEDDSIGILLGARSSEAFEMHGVPQLHLGGVDLAAATTLIGRAGYDVEPEVVRALREAVGGNPLALLELPGVLDADQRAGRRPLGDQLPVTARVERAFLTRIERLDADGRRALLLAAASDSDDVETVRRAAPQSAAGLEQAERIGLVSVRRDRIEFRHPLVRSAAYTAATDEERRAAHRALAAGLAEAHPARRAWHLVAAGAEPDNDVSGDLADAGLAARRRGACAGAARLLERAAAVTPGQELRARRLLLAGEAAWLAGQLRQADALLDRSEALTEDAELAGDITVARWWVATSASSPQPLFGPLVARAGELAASHPRKAAMMLAVAWDWAWSSLDINGARKLADRAEELVSGDLAAADREVLTALAWQRLADCRVSDALHAARMAIAAAAGPAGLQVAYACEVLSAADQLDEAHSALADSIAELTRLGHMPALCYGLRTRATIELRQGRMVQALKTAGEALALAQEGRASWPGWAIAQVAAVEAVFGLDERCREHVRRAEQSCGGNDRWAAAEAQAALGLLELGAGEDGAALSALNQADHLLQPLRHPGFVRYAADRIEALVRLGDTAAAEVALADLEQRATAAQSPWGRHAVSRARILVAPAELLDAACQQVPATPVRSGFEAARTRLIYGERLRRAGRRMEAREHLRSALGTFHAIGAEPWERRAQTELRASGGRLRRPDPSPRDQLTPQELQVALVVAEGVTNREAAARLFLSPKTIEVHLSRAYRKLGVRTRTELSRRIALRPSAGSSLAPVRTLSTVLCVGFVNPHDTAASGDNHHAVSVAHSEEAAAAAVMSYGGRLVKAAGEGVLAMFDAPSAALHCAFDICAAASDADVRARASVHAGEVDNFPDGEVRGIAVQVADRVLAHASPGEVVVTQTVRDAVYGSSLAFSPRSHLDLAGAGSWSLFTAVPP
ncbi:MAG TPA: AAA family ATPase [Streptosporangiaceae bacterium]|jgi:DNA-binding CsgD family transcriptional regulator|nr:AAA family ATPase [Streptosporangiaceae bacterium]